VGRQADRNRMRAVEASARERQGAPKCAWHRPSDLGYISKQEDAERRLARGEEQRQCPTCQLWFWPHEYGEEPTRG
jgi:hypothetical protein